MVLKRRAVYGSVIGGTNACSACQITVCCTFEAMGARLSRLVVFFY